MGTHEGDFWAHKRKKKDPVPPGERTLVICGGYVEFERYLNRVVKIGNRENRYKGYPYIHVKNSRMLATYKKGDEVVLFGNYQDNPVYQGYLTYQKVRNIAKPVADPGGGGVRGRVTEGNMMAEQLIDLPPKGPTGPAGPEAPDSSSDST